MKKLFSTILLIVSAFWLLVGLSVAFDYISGDEGISAIIISLLIAVVPFVFALRWYLNCRNSAIKEFQKEAMAQDTELSIIASEEAKSKQQNGASNLSFFNLIKQKKALSEDIKQLQAKKTELQIEEEEIERKIAIIQKKRDEDFRKAKEERAVLKQEIASLKEQTCFLEDSLVIQDVALYNPRYDFMKSEQYAAELEKIRAEQRRMVENDTAVMGATNWTVNGSLKEGSKMVTDTKKLLLRAFNNECDSVVSKVKYTNFEPSLKKIYKSAETISRLGKTMNISISQGYLDAKEKELELAFEYQQKKQEEKEKEKIAKEEQREYQKFLRECEEKERRLQKEQAHYQAAVQKILQQLELFPNNEDLLIRKQYLYKELEEIEKGLRDIEYRQANFRAGYVYIISNIGSFGENVFKIGMTRRLDPMDRVYELSSASVPFNYDVHAMIFSDDAPSLEAELHRAFDDKKVNLVNHRREFFHVSLDEIKKYVWDNYDSTVEFTDVADAEQYRVSKTLRGESNDI